MRRLAVVSAVLLSACASSQQGTTSAPPPTEQTVHVATATGATGSTMSMTQGDDPSQRTVAASAARVWDALPAVYQSLGLPITDRNVQSQSIGTTSFKVRRRLGDAPLSRYLDCGDTQGSPSANSYEVVLSVNTRLAPAAGDSTNVSTTVTAQARPVFVSGEYVNCGSTRALEKRFFDILTAELRR
jgi:hypothetical protein